jgi:hypothetical protein
VTCLAPIPAPDAVTRPGREVTLGGRRGGVQRPQVTTADGSEEVALRIYEAFADRDPMTRLVLEQMLAGVSTRRLRRTREPVGEEASAVERPVLKSRVPRVCREDEREPRRAAVPQPG